MVETFRKQEGAREASEKMKVEGEKKVHEQKQPAQIVKREEKVEAKADEKTKATQAVKKHEHAAKEEKPAEKKEEKPVEKKVEKEEVKREIVLERVFTVPLAEAYSKPAKKRAATAVKMLRGFLSRHMKSQVVKIDPEVNSFIETRGATSPAKSVRVNASKDKAGIVLAKLAGIE